MSGTVRTLAFLLNLFRSGQAPGSITAQDEDDFVASVGGIAAAQMSLGSATGRYYSGVSPTAVSPVPMQSGTAKVQVFEVTTPTTFTKSGVEILPSIPASRLNDFTKSVGVNIHVSQQASPYLSSSNILHDLSTMGITLVRDNDSSVSAVNTIYGAMGAAGIRFDFVTFSSPTSYVTNVKAAVTAGVPASAIVAMEGINEPNVNTVTYNGYTCPATWIGVMQHQEALYQLVKTDPVLGNVLVATPSASGQMVENTGIQWLTVPIMSYENYYNGSALTVRTACADGTVFADMYNSHQYSYPFTVDQTIYNPTYGDRVAGIFVTDFSPTQLNNYTGPSLTQLFASPRMISECGIQTDVSAGTGQYMNQATQAKQLLNGMFQSFADHNNYFIIYEMYDYSSTFWGLYSAFNTPKTSGTYIANVMTILADAGTDFATFNAGSPGSLGFTSALPALSYYHTFQKSDGSYWVAIWCLIQDWNGSTNAPITITGTSITIGLTQTFATINVYDPTIGTTIQATTTNASTVTVTLKDYPLLIQLVPSASTTHVQWAIYNTANGVPTGSPVYNSSNHLVPLAADVIEETGLSVTLQPGVYAAAVVTDGPTHVRGIIDYGVEGMGMTTSKTTGLSMSFSTTLNTGTPASTWPSNPSVTATSGSTQPLIWMRP